MLTPSQEKKIINVDMKLFMVSSVIGNRKNTWEIVGGIGGILAISVVSAYVFL